ncbi:hypothetical protein OESDEN_11300, partial [Oesophagostomum dentatum]
WSMAASNEIIRACLLCEFKLGTKAAEACRKICAAFGEGAIAERTGQKWLKKFSSGNENLEDEPRSGRPSTVNNEDIKLAIEQDSSQTCQDFALKFNVSDETIVYMRINLENVGS